MLQSFSIFYPIQVLLCCFPWLPQIHKNWSFEAQGLRGGTAPHVDTALLKAQINCLTSQRDEALHVLQQLEDFATAVYPAYKSLSLKKLKAKLNVRGDCNSKLYTFYQTTLYLLSDLEKRKETISSLTSEILRFGDTQLEANRDDYYFATKFAGVFRAVEEWVYLKFLDADIEQQLEAGAVNLLRERAGGDWQRWLKEEHLLLLTSVVSEMLVSQVLEPPLLGVVDSFVALIKSAIEKSFLESRQEGPNAGSTSRLTPFTDTDADIKWRAKTIEVLTDSPLFWEAFQPTAYNVFDSILNTFSPLTYKDTQTRTKKLAALIKEGGSVAIECQKEPSQFKFKRFPPGSRWRKISG
ncbi:hypothetical protein L211DRAFT_497575 [Terfezia boudieri ATCC MYA-4762]|uniref:Uncharacterized protein n=1 Tax=Terfezia boudieri ATCC MYA-4762 TaxID=1051890 RepID=A0A3N4LHD8_9PEZI|nr:hypothetical protein L211DRAFT_497575 [Terfezia boudieri ATCC MYA-4762]